ncbi:MAG: hypothetical protein N0C84_17895 [Candidatus Thiodiazotropha taylori]|uniref:Uncharacterized protein n=1 Tax=Candidatus Thiodiazotropha taylori TaxID=2792791 RepID=A0A9E4N667_9GAMM|nr:hypothetical protein [Candidatus Thiodiazotropha taylori]MCG7862825.1 hypothetical protein [Candidatus Thiodiazotropha endolucinida]MCG7948215.1 hypothetical protein [Candidatus Thiodiazotropha taylori]MCW4258340.1 hypothetical protein [Candidatus Thiodiazotropha taylori]
MNQILEFINRGVLFDIALGQLKEKVLDKIGEPSDVVNLSDELDLCAYGYGLELYFEKDMLNKISIKYEFDSESFKLPSYFGDSNGDGLNGLKSIDHLVDVFQENGFEWSIKREFSDDTTICLICNDVSYVYYSLDAHHILSIQSIPSEY